MALGELRERTGAALRAGSERAVLKHRAAGKMSARERVLWLLDTDSLLETDQLARHGAADAPGPYGDGVITGTGTIDGRPVCVFSQDFTVLGGSMGETHGRKILKTMDTAVRLGCPVISINESGGARIQEGVVSLAYYAELGRRNVRASGLVPQIALIAGPCAGGAVYSPALMDVVVMVDRSSYMFVTGPDVLRSVTGEDVTVDELGGARANAAVSGNCHHVARDEAEALEWIQELLSYLPSNAMELPPAVPFTPVPGRTARDLALDTLVPDADNQGYDVREVISAVVDDAELLEIHAQFAPNIVCGLARVEGRPVGVVANQPLHRAGALDIDATEKAARFVRFCDAFNLPVLTFVDVPGYLPGVAQERDGIIRRGAKLLHAYAEATVPKVTVVLRKAYGGAYAVMGSKHLGADCNLAWPTAQIAVMGGEAAVEVLHRRRLAEAGEDAPAVREALVEEYRRTLMTPYAAAERGYVDAVIEPSSTRAQVGAALRALSTKREAAVGRKHGNIPL
nr:acyl-CoA carboxylase subunit beta [Kitasatospora phosalacinea]